MCACVLQSLWIKHVLYITHIYSAESDLVASDRYITISPFCSVIVFLFYIIYIKQYVRQNFDKSILKGLQFSYFDDIQARVYESDVFTTYYCPNLDRSTLLAPGKKECIIIICSVLQQRTKLVENDKNAVIDKDLKHA